MGKIRVSELFGQIEDDWRSERGCLSDERIAACCNENVDLSVKHPMWLHIESCRVCLRKVRDLQKALHTSRERSSATVQHQRAAGGSMENFRNKHMWTDLAKIYRSYLLFLITEGEPIETRLFEDSDRDRECFPSSPPQIPDLFISEDSLVALLYELKSQGLVDRSDPQHASMKHICWKCGKRSPAHAGVEFCVMWFAPGRRVESSQVVGEKCACEKKVKKLVLG